MKKQNLMTAIVTIIIFALIGCTSPPTSSPTPTPSLLTETHIFPNFDFSIDYPEGWTVANTSPYSIICELEEDKKNLMLSNNEPASGYCIAHDHRSMDYMQEVGLPADPTLEDLFQLNVDLFNYQDPETSETTLFGAPALQVKAHNQLGTSITLMGFVNDEVFILEVTAPTEESLEAFSPMWEEMLASIEPMVRD